VKIIIIYNKDKYLFFKQNYNFTPFFKIKIIMGNKKSKEIKNELTDVRKLNFKFIKITNLF
jgi:hypothetical protein